MTNPTPAAAGVLPEVTDALTLHAMLDTREKAAGLGVADAEAALARAKSAERDTNGLIEDLETAGCSTDTVDCLITLAEAERASRVAVGRVVSAAHETQRRVLFCLWAAAKHVQLAGQGAAGAFYRGSDAAPAAAEPGNHATEAGARFKIGDLIMDAAGTAGTVREFVKRDPAWKTSGARIETVKTTQFGGNPGTTTFVPDYLLSNWRLVPLEWSKVPGCQLEERYVWATHQQGGGIRRELREITEDQEGELGSDAASWSAADAELEDQTPAVQTGRRPRATYMDWQRSQLVNLGATTRDEWYWQCPTTGCKVWAGPYSDPMKAKKAGFAHVYGCEKTDYFRRGRSS